MGGGGEEKKLMELLEDVSRGKEGRGGSEMLLKLLFSGLADTDRQENNRKERRTDGNDDNKKTLKQKIETCERQMDARDTADSCHPLLSFQMGKKGKKKKEKRLFKSLEA